MKTKDGVVEVLRRTALLHACTDDELSTIARAADMIRVDEGALLAAPGHRPNPLLLVGRGEANVLTGDGVRVLRDDTLIGAADELAGRRRDDVITAATDADVFVLDPRRLASLARECPGLALALLRRLALDAVS